MEVFKTYKTYILLLIALVYICIEASQVGGDFVIFLTASQDLYEGVNIYTKTYFDGYHYLYSVLFALLLKPFTLLPPSLSLFIWLGLNLFFLYRIWKIICTYFNLSAFSEQQHFLFVFLSFVFAGRFIRDNFHLAQMTTLMLYLSLEGLQFIQHNKPKPGAALIALGINIKLLPLVLLPYLIWRKQFKAAVYTFAFFCFFLALPAVFIGKQQNKQLLGDWWQSINPTQQQHVIDVDERSFHGLSTLLPTLLMESVPDIHALTLKRNVADVSVETVNVVLNSVRLILIVFALYFLGHRPFQEFENKEKVFWELSYILLLIPLIFPHQQYYAFLFTMPASTYLLYYLITQKNSLSKNRFKLISAILVFVYLCFNLNLILGEFKAYYEHYKIITYGALLLIPLLAMCRSIDLRHE